MKSILPTVTVTLCAFNEEENVVACLRSILEQKEEGFRLSKILVVSDGSTDATVSLLKVIRDPRLEVWNFRNRSGKSNRLNQIYSYLISDILVQTDADILLAHPLVIADLIEPLIGQNTVGMCGGNPQPLLGETFVEKVVNVTTAAYIPLRSTLRGGNNIFSADGRLLAYRREFVKQIRIPADMIANDIYTYFCCLTFGYQYKFVRSAFVYYRSPQTLSDHLAQNTRFQAARQRMKKYFPEVVVEQEFHIPRLLFWRNLFSQFLKHPLHAGFIFLVNKYSHLKSRLVEERFTAKWPIAISTKKLTAVQ